MFVYQLSLLCSLLLSEAFAQEVNDGSEESEETVVETANPDEVSGTSDAPAPIEADTSEQNSTSTETNGSVANEYMASEQDIANFRQTFQRYSERMKDFRDETMVMVDIKKIEAETEIVRSYEKPLQALSQDKFELRDTAVSKFEQFLTKYPNKPQGAEIRFQLAEIYFEEASERYLLEQEQQDILLDENPDLELPAILVDMTRPVKLYEEIVNRFPRSEVTDGALYMLGFCLGSEQFKQFDEDRSVAYFEQLLSDHPESKFAAETHYVVGEHYFNINESNTARHHFDRAVALSRPKEGEYSSQYEFALYRLAWTHYRLENYDEALRLFSSLQDYSMRKNRDTGQPVDAMEESMEYTAFSFIDISVDEGETPLDIGKRYYDESGDREYSAGVYYAMAEILEKQELNLEAIDVYRYLQEKWPYAPENPTYQKQVAILLAEEGEDEAYNEALRDLTEIYAENGEWWRQNRNNPEAQDTAKAYIEDFLLDVAQNQLATAYASNDPEDYRLAAEHYSNYLSRFPFADDFYEAQWYLSLSYEGAEQPEKAIEQFELLVKSSEDHNYGEIAQVKKLFGLYSMIQNMQMGDFSQLPEDAEVFQKELLPDDSERLIYSLAPEMVSFIRTFETSKSLDFERRKELIQQQMAEEEDPKKLETLELASNDIGVAQEYLLSQEKSIEYNIGQMYASHGQFDKAREQFNKIIDTWTDSIEAEYSASAIISMYQDQLNWAMVKQEAQRFMGLALGPEGNIDEEGFADYIQNATLQLVQKILYDARDLMKEGKVEQGTAQLNLAAQGYEDYLEQYPDIPIDEYALNLLVAANAYGDARNIEKANELNRKYVNMFPQREASRALLFQIADNHRDALELEEAIKYYDILYNQTYGKGIPYEDGISAKFNSAILKVGLGDYEGAAKGLEFYVRKFPNLPNSELTYFSIGKYWEKVSDYKALEFYTKYLRKYGDQNSDRTMEAHYRRIQIYEKQGNKQRFLNKEWKELMKAYERLLAKNGEASPLMRKYAAEYELAEIPAKLEKFKSYKYTRSDQRNAEIMQEAKADFITLKEECLAYGEKYKDLAALMAGGYCVGDAQLFLADFLRALPLDNVPFEQQIIFEEKIEEEVGPIEAAGIEGLEQVMEISEKREVWNDWSQKALDELSSRDPKSYPPQKTEIRYQLDSQYVPVLGPISIELEKSRIIQVEEEIEAPEETPDDGALNEEEMIDDQENVPEDGTNTQEDLPTWGSPEEQPEEQPEEKGENDETDGE